MAWKQHIVGTVNFLNTLSSYIHNYWLINDSDETYSTPIGENDGSYITSKMLKAPREYSRFAKGSTPLAIGLTEYKDEYLPKSIPYPTKGISVEETTTCPVNFFNVKKPLPSNFLLNSFW